MTKSVRYSRFLGLVSSKLNADAERQTERNRQMTDVSVVERFYAVMRSRLAYNARVDGKNIPRK